MGNQNQTCVTELEWRVSGLCIFITCDIAGQPEVGGGDSLENHLHGIMDCMKYRAWQVTCQKLEAWLSCYVECHHGISKSSYDYSESNNGST